ncbi:UNVERIFIED_CONTAM: 4-alpha-glucanotransferase, chloroplastic/amyloplastic, partial [Sesamum latifolium]
MVCKCQAKEKVHCNHRRIQESLKWQPTSLSLFPASPSSPPKPILPAPVKPSRVTVRFKNGGALSAGEDLPLDYETWLPKRDVKDRRRAGILLHPTSLPGPFGIGDLGPQAFQFVDWLHDAGCSLWQVLPLVPPGRRADEEGSPYSGQDANCGNTLLISLEELVKDGLLSKEELPKPLDTDRVNFTAVADIKDPLVAEAAKRLILSEGELKDQLLEFRKDPSIAGWLEDAAYFAAIDDTLNTFSWQWQKVHDYARMKGINIMGDMPIYVGYHSADVWANKKQFLLNGSGFPLLVSGVPPDAFSETGQLWNSPLYDWKAMERDGFSWWIRRIRRAQNLFDDFRIDHFRGFAGFWAVPSEAKVAMVGRWKVGPGKSLFDAIFRAVGDINIIAEDLGVITEDVVQLRRSIGAPGMAVLQFGFGSDAGNPHLPHNHEQNQVVYTGTHDNDTIRGWWDILPQEEKSNAALSSVARTAIIPMQDVLGLGSSARMNIPATQYGNWSWRVPKSKPFDSLTSEAKRLREMLVMY